MAALLALMTVMTAAACTAKPGDETSGTPVPPTVTDEDLRRFIILVEGTKGFNIVDELDRIRCPVMAVGVFEDRVLDSDATMEIAESLDWRADFRLYMYIGYGHAAFDTAPDYRERMLNFFLS